ncbi:hypothetical protein [Polaribacter sp. Hel1_85]|uniref:hypothetical protein n=1 Tax=Polaribacter sp. Hel1_85 TaxID=1250005 RepID=UPI00052CC802|nr:hypothetical protein [Polaribacter sp. Hel1_85]KGL63540.1 conserved hypothetical membrane protein [Polaribacter sp. Hel1_85]
MIKAKTQSFIALAYFLIASSLGIILRLFPTININANYKFIVHTHSHIALLGWVYVGLTTLIFHLFIKSEAQKKYLKLFFATQITLIGMLISFPITGYALFSIIFSTLFLICSYWFYGFYRKNNSFNKDSYASKFIYTSLIFMITSSIGPWALGIIMNTLGSTSHWYKNAIYFYLHFQYNGWFTFCLLGLLFYLLEKNTVSIPKKVITDFYRLMVYSCVLTLFLSFLWTDPPFIVYFLAIIGVFYQLFAFLKLYQLIKKYKAIIKNSTSFFFYKLLNLVFILFSIKIAMQSITTIPYFATLSFQIKDFVIGYLHLVFLGIISLTLLYFLHQNKLISIPKKWLIMYLIGFILSEILIFYKGFSNWQQLSIIENYYILLIIVSALMPIGIIGVFFSNLKSTFSTPKESL